MLDRFFHSPYAAFAFIFFVFVLFAFYMVNRERAKVQQLRGPRRFQPKWTSQRRGRRTRRRSGGQFKPDWTPRKGRTPEPAPDREPESPESTPGESTPGESTPDQGPDRG